VGFNPFQGERSWWKHDKRQNKGAQKGAQEESFRMFTRHYSLNLAHTGAWSDGFSMLRMS
jgi:hypothetical protein